MEGTSPVRILSWNIRGFRETINGIKINKFKETDVIDLFSKHDIVICQETHLTREEAKEIYLPDFSPGVHYCRQKRAKAPKASGGVSVFIKEHIRKFVKFLPQSNSDIVWMMIHKGNNYVAIPDTYIGCVYIPPESSSYGKDHTKTIWDQLEKDTEHFSTRGNVILCGDFNARTGNLEDFIKMDGDNNVYDIPSCYITDKVHKRHSSDKVIQKFGRKLTQMCIDNNMYILNGRTLGDLQGNPTCLSPQGKSVVDYFVCSQNFMQMILKFHVGSLTMFSDHCPIELYIHLPIEKSHVLNNQVKSNVYNNKHNLNQAHNPKSEKKNTSYTFIWEEESAEKIQWALDTKQISNRIEAIDINLTKPCSENKEYSKAEIEKSVTELTDTVISVATLSLKHKTKRRQYKNKKQAKKWFTRECYIQRKEVRSLLNALNRQPFRKDIQAKYFSALKTYNRTVKRVKTEYKNKLVSNLNAAMENDPNEVWKILSDLKNTETQSHSHRHALNTKKWISHLQNLIGQEVNVNENRREHIKRELDEKKLNLTNTYIDNPITIKEVIEATKKLKPKKAPGKDGVTNEIIKACIPSISNVVCKLFNKILQTGSYPAQWKDGINVPIYKNGDPSNPSNYRGITLNSCFGKLFCLIINERIERYLENNNLLIKEQAGFRKQSRTTDHIFILKKIVDDVISKRNGRLYSCFVDFNKAFDNIWHDALLLKLNKIGITGRCFSVIEDMYTDSKICARNDGILTEPFHIKKGVLQGNVLSPTLFNIFINDIKEVLQHDDSPYINKALDTRTPCLLYADDIVLLSTTKIGLQNQMDRLYEYCQSWGLSINRTKTKIIIFTKNDPKILPIFTCGEDFIEIVDEYKYLGVIFHKTGKFQAAEEHLAKQGNKAAHALRRNVHGKEIKADVMIQLFDTLVYPIITYGCEVWFPFNQAKTSNLNLPIGSDQFTDYLSSKRAAENVHVKYCRNLLGIHSKSMKIPVLAELGRFPITLPMISKVIAFWTHITESKEESYLKLAYKDLSSGDSHKGTWADFVKNTLHNIGFQHVWNNQCTLSSSRLKYSVLSKLKEEYVTFWRNAKKECTRLSFYNKITDSYTLQPYLVECKNMKHRITLCRLRLSAHDLEIERGRYHNLVAQDRVCKLCAIKEDEIHFLDKCPLYEPSRSKFLSTINQKLNPNLERHKSPSFLFPLDYGQTELAKYVFDCFEIRKKFLLSRNVKKKE